MALMPLRKFLLFAAGDAQVFADITKKAALGEVSYPEKTARAIPVLPAGARSCASFRMKCVGCLKCVTACPQNILRVSHDGAHAPRPALDFRHGWCLPTCQACATACPTGAISPLDALAVKRRVAVGVAVWNASRCLRVTKGTICTACVRHCPEKAIALEPHPKSKLPVPSVTKTKCIGCGACEHYCPVRPQVAIHVEGTRVHDVRTAGEDRK